MFPSTACLLQHKIGATRRVGLRPRRRVLGVHLRADDGGAARRQRCARPRAGRGRRRDVEHHRLHGPHDLRAVRRRRRRGRDLARAGRRPEHPRLRVRDRRQRRAVALHAGGRQPAAGVARDGRAAAALREAGRRRRCSSSRCGRRRRSARRAARAQRPDRLPTSTSSCRTRPTGASSCRPPSASALDEAKVVINIGHYGNTTAATIPLALNDAVADGRLKKGNLVLLTSVGAGFTVGSVLLRWAI